MENSIEVELQQFQQRYQQGAGAEQLNIALSLASLRELVAKFDHLPDGQARIFVYPNLEWKGQVKTQPHIRMCVLGTKEIHDLDVDVISLLN